METTHDFWESSAGRQYWLHITTPAPDTDINGVILVFHGLAEHGGCFDKFSEEMARRGVVTYVLDRNGHGKTLKDTEDVVTYQGVTNEEEQNDFGDLLKDIKSKYTDKPFILFGHSAGSVLALYTAVYNDIGDSFPVVLSGFPGILPKSVLVPFKFLYLSCGSQADEEKRRSIAKVFNTLSIERFSSYYKKEGENSWVVSHPEGLKRYTEDPLCGGPTKSEFVEHMVEQMLYILNNMERATKMKITFVYGICDPCCGFGKTIRSFCDRLRREKERILTSKDRDEALIEKMNPTGPVAISFEARHALHMESPEIVQEVCKYVVEQFVPGKTLGNK